MKCPLVYILVCACIAGACSTGGDSGDATKGSLVRRQERYKAPESYNFIFRGIDTNITDPGRDRRAYYRIFIDKVDEGRTTTGLESQEKSCEALLSPNRHLLSVEKWILDERQGKYLKLNNIDQPRPSYVYFELPEGRIIVIVMKNDGERAVFSMDYLRE